MAWSKSRRADGKETEDGKHAGEVNGERTDTKGFIAEMESKLANFDARLRKRQHELVVAQADIVELEQLINAASQAIGTARPTDRPATASLLGDRSSAARAHTPAPAIKG